MQSNHDTIDDYDNNYRSWFKPGQRASSHTSEDFSIEARDENVGTGTHHEGGFRRLDF